MNESAVWVKFEQHRFVLGMEWRSLASGEKLVRGTMSKLRREGAKWYAASGLQDVVGVSNGIAQAKQPMYSAALHLASQWSNGGLELFVFGVADQRVAVVALNNRHPQQGFDFIGSLSEAQALVEEFEEIHEGELVRRVGDLGLLVNEEQLNAQTVFDQPSSEAKLKKVPSLRSFLMTMGVLVLALAGLGGVYYMQLQYRDQFLASQGPPPPPDPNPAYNQRVSQLLQDMPDKGQALYQEWVKLGQRLPLSHQGWVLIQLECKDTVCNAEWKRQFGSVDDFFAQLPLSPSNAQHLPVDKDALTHRLQTNHATPAKATDRPYAALADLPKAAESFRNISSWLQDLSLLGATKVQVDKPSVWEPGDQAALLKAPLFKGTWGAEVPLSMMADLGMPPFANVTLLKTNLGEVYQLNGDFYGRAD